MFVFWMLLWPKSHGKQISQVEWSLILLKSIRYEYEPNEDTFESIEKRKGNRFDESKQRDDTVQMKIKFNWKKQKRKKLLSCRPFGK